MGTVSDEVKRQVDVGIVEVNCGDCVNDGGECDDCTYASEFRSNVGVLSPFWHDGCEQCTNYPAMCATCFDEGTGEFRNVNPRGPTDVVVSPGTHLVPHRKSVSEYADDIVTNSVGVLPVIDGHVVIEKKALDQAVRIAAADTVQRVIKDCDTYESDMK